MLYEFDDFDIDTSYGLGFVCGVLVGVIVCVGLMALLV